jgi:hypothetical protein
MKYISGIFKTITLKIKKIIWVLGLHAFSLLLLLVFISIILGGFIFYKYVFLAERKQPEATQNVIKFDYNAYKDVLEKIQPTQQNGE